jgi:hypothetical protein
MDSIKRIYSESIDWHSLDFCYKARGEEARFDLHLLSVKDGTATMTNGHILLQSPVLINDGLYEIFKDDTDDCKCFALCDVDGKYPNPERALPQPDEDFIKIDCLGFARSDADISISDVFYNIAINAPQNLFIDYKYLSMIAGCGLEVARVYYESGKVVFKGADKLALIMSFNVGGKEGA